MDNKRKGLNKISYQHPLDVVNNSYIKFLNDADRSAKIYKCCLLHDVLEDTDYTSEQLKEMLDVYDDEIEIIELLSRNIENKDGSDYIEGIVANEDALIVKLADRIANMKDLIIWVKKDGMTEESKKLAEKYFNETQELLDLTTLRYPKLVDFNNKEVHPFAYQVSALEDLLVELGELMDKPINERVLDGEKEIEDITVDDIYNTYAIIKDMYIKSEHLQKQYPKFLERLDKVIDTLEKKIEKYGRTYVEKLFKKVKFDEEDFFQAYMDYVNRELFKKINEIQNFREDVPKTGLIKELAKDMGLTIGELMKKLKSRDRKELKQIYDKIKKIMDKDFDKVYKIAKEVADKFGGEIKYRPTKYKDTERAIDKFLKNVDDPNDPTQDFLDLTDLMGFRAVFDEVEPVIDFTLGIVRNKDNYVFKLKKYLGKGSAYQGINMNINYDGKFNYEMQAVLDKVQIATDLNHDIFYKKIIEINDKEKKAVVMLVQICLALLLDDLFNFSLK